MDFDQLRYFVSVAQTLNFTQAAKLHYVTQPAISRRITDLEKELDVKLFIRSSHQVQLTRAGEEFFRYALSALDNNADAAHRVRSIAAGKTGRIRISAVGATEHLIHRTLALFSRRYPNVEIDLDFCTGMVQLSAINKGEYDFYFSFESLLQSTQRLEYQVTDMDRFHLFVPGSYAHLVDINDFSALGDLPLVTESHSEGPFLVDRVFEICQTRGFDVGNLIACHDLRTVVAFINAGMGFTLLPRVVGRCVNTDHVVSFSIPGEDALTTNAIGWDPKNENNTAMEFIRVIRELYGEGRPPEMASPLL